jgi:two-component system response regulator HydG
MPATSASDSDAARDATVDTIGRLLVVDDEADVCELLRLGLARLGHQIDTATSLAQARALLEENGYDSLLLDLRLGAEDGLELCREVVAGHPDLPVVVITGYGSMESAVGAIRAGAYDFVTKPVVMDALSMTVGRAVRHHRLESEVRRLRAQTDRDAQVQQGILGDSSAIKRMLRVIEQVAESDATVLVTGESGTGKELVARQLHKASARCGEPFLPVNCAALPANLLESELFGHVRGAFTDAKTARKGLFLEAGDGTLFLDEIGELPHELQPKLLRVLQERKVRAVGGTQEHAINARLIAATNRDLEQDVEDGRFREDLFYRVNVIRVQVPRLAARANDVLLLAQHFLQEISARSGKRLVGITPEAAAKLLDYDWPGNVRELQNAMERAVALARYDHVTVDELPDRIREYESERIVLADAPEHMLTLAQLERRYIFRLLNAVGGNKTRAAQILGLDRRTLYRKLEKYEKEDE